MTARGVGHWNLEDAPLSSLGLVSHSSWLPLGSPQRSQQLTSYPTRLHEDLALRPVHPDGSSDFAATT
jgi:hypothetical protein